MMCRLYTVEYVNAIGLIGFQFIVYNQVLPYEFPHGIVSGAPRVSDRFQLNRNKNINVVP